MTEDKAKKAKELIETIAELEAKSELLDIALAANFLPYIDIKGVFFEGVKAHDYSVQVQNDIMSTMELVKAYKDKVDEKIEEYKKELEEL